MRFHKVNLVEDSGKQINQDKKWQSIVDGMTIKADTRKHTRYPVNGAYDAYLNGIEYDDIGPFDDLCKSTSEPSLNLDHVELR